ncbi:MAG: hypothetical protein K0S32_3403 [Bacteroidetes bacterium]|jgi:hypothetical protein|nr:hypothetical protein [Bacteroidota bacterium]
MLSFFKKNIPVFIAFIASCSTIFAQKNNLQTQAFLKNKGQIVKQDFSPNTDVLYLYVGKGIKVQLRKTGYSYELFSADNLPHRDAGKKNRIETADLLKTTIQTSRIDIDFAGMNPSFEIIEEEKQNSTFNYFTFGNECANVNSFRKIIYKNIYPKTDIEFTLTDNASSPLKYNIILSPGADINNVKFLCKGATSVKRINNAQIDLATPLGTVSENIPLSFYSDTPQKKEEVNFNVSGNIFSFSSPYDNSRQLIIDPSTNIIWGTYFGDASLDNCTSVGTDANNNVFISGYTLSSSNIATAGTYQSTLGGVYDLYLAKFTPSGSLTWGTYFGGTGVEISYAMHVEPNGAIYICGDASSTVNVASSGAHQTVYGGGIDDAILAKFDTNGQRIWSTYYGGLQHDIAYVLTVDGNGNPIIAGHTESSNTGNCIATSGAYLTNFILAADVFIAKFNSNGVRQWGTFYGDSDFEEAWGIDCDASNNIIITGFSGSLSGMSTPPCHQNFCAGGQDAFIAKFNSSGNTLIWGTYFGGLGNEQGSGVEIDNSGTIFITGNTTSPTGISTPGVYQPAIGSSDDAFITAFSSSGTQLWGTYFGGEDTDYINDFLLDGNMNLFICGQTLSTMSISTVGAYQPSLATMNSYDGYFAKFTNNGTKMFSTYYGGESNDNVKSIALDNTNKVYLVGETTSTMGISTPGSFMSNYATAGDAFLAKFCVAPNSSISPAGNATICTNINYTLTAPTGFTYFWNTAVTNSFVVMTQPHTPGNYYFTVILTDAYGCNALSDSTKITVDNCITSLGTLTPESAEPNIYPIPFQEHISVELKSDSFIRIFSATGALVYESVSAQAKQDITTTGLKPGVYYLVVCTDGKNYSKKIIKAP